MATQKQVNSLVQDIQAREAMTQGASGNFVGKKPSKLPLILIVLVFVLGIGAYIYFVKMPAKEEPYVPPTRLVTKQPTKATSTTPTNKIPAVASTTPLMATSTLSTSTPAKVSTTTATTTAKTGTSTTATTTKK